MPDPTEEEMLAILAADLAEAKGEDDPRVGREGEPCPHCGEPANAFDACSACGEEGCLPRDDWMPGEADCCLTRCARCAFEIHLDCGSADHTGNLLCPTCRPQGWDELD